MKTKTLLFVAASAIITLSFTFASSANKDKKVKVEQTSLKGISEPAGGFISEDRL